MESVIKASIYNVILSPIDLLHNGYHPYMDFILYG